MSWEAKTDYCGVAVSGKLAIKASTMNRSGQYLEQAGKSGAICATKAFGVVDAPNCEYVIEKPHSFESGDIKLGSVTTIGGKRYSLASIHYENGADQESVFTAASQEIEATSDTTQRTFDVPAFDISPDEAAEMIMSAGTVGGTGCELTKCTLDASASVKTHTVNALPVASDVTMGRATVQIEVLQTGDTVPTLQAGDGWDVAAPLTCTDPDADFPTWTATLSKPLAYTVVSAQSTQS